jgi:hypothetical protein
MTSQDSFTLSNTMIIALDNPLLEFWDIDDVVQLANISEGECRRAYVMDGTRNFLRLSLLKVVRKTCQIPHFQLDRT